MASDRPMGNIASEALDFLMLTMGGHQLFSQGGAQSKILGECSPTLWNQEE